MATTKSSRIELAKEYISPAIFLLKEYVKEKTAILNSIPDSPASSRQKAETEDLINQFSMAVRNLETNIKPLDKEIIDSLLILRQQRIQQCKQPPQMTPLGVPPTQSKNVQPNALLAAPKVNGISTLNFVSKANTQPNYSEYQVNDFSCPFCSREYTSKPPLQKHIQDDHPKHNEIYRKISSLTSDFLINSKTTLPDNNQCFYCDELFRSTAPLFRHIQEKHVEFFDIFVKVSLIKGKKSFLKSNIVPFIRNTLPPLNAFSLARPSTSNLDPSLNSAPSSAPISSLKLTDLLIGPTLIHPPPSIESHINGISNVLNNCTFPVFSRVNQANRSGAISTPQNARKSIKTSSISRLTSGVASASPVTNHNNNNDNNSTNNNLTPSSVHTAGPSLSESVVSPSTNCHQSLSLASICEVIAKPSPPAIAIVSPPAPAPLLHPRSTQETVATVASERAHSARKRRTIPPSVHAAEPSTSKKVVSTSTRFHQSPSLTPECEITIRPFPTATATVVVSPPAPPALPLSPTTQETSVVSERVHSARKRRSTNSTPSPTSPPNQGKKRNRRSCYLDDSFTCSECDESYDSANALSVHRHHCDRGLKKPHEQVIEGTSEKSSIADACEVMQSQVVSLSSLDSNGTLIEETMSGEDEGQLTDSNNRISAHLKRRLIRTIRDVEVALPTIHQEDLVACMRTPAFRKLQTLFS